MDLFLIFIYLFSAFNYFIKYVLFFNEMKLNIENWIFEYFISNLQIISFYINLCFISIFFVKISKFLRYRYFYFTLFVINHYIFQTVKSNCLCSWKITYLYLFIFSNFFLPIKVKIKLKILKLQLVYITFHPFNLTLSF